MKDLIIFITKTAFITLVFILSSFVFPSESNCFLKGDINNDDKIDLLETVHSLQVVSGSRATTASKVIYVPADIPTIQQAIDAASEGDTINVAAGTYNETLFISKSGVTLQGAGRATTFLDGGGQNVITMDGARRVVIIGVTVRNGNDGIIGQRGTTFEVRDTTVQDSADEGIQVDENSTARITDCTVQRSGDDGIGVYRNSSATFSGTIHSSNNGYGLDVQFTSSSFVS